MRFLALLHTMSVSAITLYTNRMCPYAQRVAIALEHSGLPHDKVEVDLYGSKGFTKKDLKAVEAAAGLAEGLHSRALDRRRDAPRVDGVRGTVGALAPEKLAPGDAAAAAWAVAHCDGPITRAGKDAVFSGQASTPDLERALRDLDARLTRDFVAGDAFRPPTACCSRFSFASARNSKSPPTRRGSEPTSTARSRTRRSGGRWRSRIGGGGNYVVFKNVFFLSETPAL